MGSALLDTTNEPAMLQAGGGTSPLTETPGRDSADVLRQQVAERLAAHRTRRERMQNGASAADGLGDSRESARSGSSRSAQIAAAVAERYAKSQSYRAFLAAEAERAIQQAHAAAEVAARNAEAVVAAQRRLLDELDEAHAEAAAEVQAEATTEEAQELTLWPELEEAPRTPAKKSWRGPSTEPKHAARAVEAESPAMPPSAGVTVRLYEDAASAAHVGSLRVSGAMRRNLQEECDVEEAYALDEEIAFRHAPVFEEPAGPPMPLPANLLEFPRQLVASRKARPRYAEGPLREEEAAAPGAGQLRIFEVETAQISTEPAVESDAVEPQWTSIWLDTPSGGVEGGVYGPEAREVAEAEAPQVVFPGLAPVGRRVLAAAINGAILTAGALVFAAGFAAVVGYSVEGHANTAVQDGLHALISAGSGVAPRVLGGAFAAAAAFLYVVYQALFLSFSGATPGMRCARIALCTFDEENPTRREIRKRAMAMVLSACPLGLGFWWAMIDDDGMTWHDRMSRMYQRSY